MPMNFRRIMRRVAILFAVAVGLILLLLYIYNPLPWWFFWHNADVQRSVTSESLNAVPTYPGRIDRIDTTYDPFSNHGTLIYNIESIDFQSAVNFYRTALSVSPWELYAGHLGADGSYGDKIYCFTFWGPLKDRSSKQIYSLSIHGDSHPGVGIFVETRVDTTWCLDPGPSSP